MFAWWTAAIAPYRRCPISGGSNVAHYPYLQLLVAIAGLDDNFCELLLRGNRERAIQDLDLTDQERLVVLAIIADSLPTFAQDLESWMLQDNVIPGPAPRIYTQRRRK
jgi:hypothetical protein